MPSQPPASDSGKRCSKCGYNLTGLTEPRCPECGTPTIAWPWRVGSPACDRLKGISSLCLGASALVLTGLVMIIS